MPFMKGISAFRNTLKYLQQGQIVFKHDVRIMAINYNIGKLKPEQLDTSIGIREVVFWHLNQLQYKNPQTQIITLKNMTPSPFITFFLGNGKKVYVDVEGKTKDDILAHLRQILGKTDEELREEKPIEDLSRFGMGCQRYCMCEVPGQVPCPSFVELPKELRGKWKAAKRRGELDE